MDRPDVADVAAAAAGDDAAFERLVRTMQGSVWRYIVHLLGDHALAEDVAQEVFFRVHRKLRTLRDPDRFVPWLLTMARNAAYDAGRSQQRRPLQLVGDQEFLVERTSPDPHLDIEVYDALARLDPELREAVVLVGVIGLKYDEVAVSIGVPEGTVKSRVFRARVQLSQTLRRGERDVS